MKQIKFLLFLCISATILSCGDKEDTPAFTLTNANIAGTYDVSSIEFKEEETATSNSVNISTTTGVGDSFDDFSFVLNANGSYSIVGKYRMVITATDNGGTPETESEINVIDAAGTYTINVLNNTITFNQTSGDFIEDEFKLVTFSESSVKMTQTEVEIDGGITYKLEGNISLVRK